jgi:quinoprotein glucose dehydrogenase
MPAPFTQQRLTEEGLTTRTPEAHAWALKEFRTFVSDGQFVPLSLGKQTVMMPGYDGGAEWGGPAVDPRTGVLYVNANGMVYTGGLEKAEAASPASGTGLYQSQCALCHGVDRSGSPPEFPSLVGIGKRMTEAQIDETVREGKGRMPSFPNLLSGDMAALVQYLLADGKEDTARERSRAAATTQPGEEYRFTGYRQFLDPDGYPATAPPWGTLNAIDMNTGKYLWKIPLGEYPALAAQGMADTGTQNYGGPVVTAGGLVFIGATVFDRSIRAFDKDTGRLLWRASLPYSGTATPATYEVDGKQYVVIAAGGGKDPSAGSGGEYVAFALP